MYPRQYVIGFGFIPNKENVFRDIVLIRKAKPEWQKGKFNVPGGKIEPEEYSGDCMVREWLEETGVETTLDSWQYVGRLYRPDDFFVAIFTQENADFIKCKTTEDKGETIHISPYYEFIHYPNLLPNLRWLYEFLHSPDFKKHGTVIDVLYPGKEFA